jgi:hypothetical protein
MAPARSLWGTHAAESVSRDSTTPTGTGAERRAELAGGKGDVDSDRDINIFASLMLISVEYLRDTSKDNHIRAR